MGKKQRILLQAGAFFIVALLSGCMPSKPVSQIAPPPPLFPPQTVMQSGDYKSFLAQNSSVLKSCSQPDTCAAALFNLCFLYCYPKSPYYDPPKAMQYISDLIAGAPESPWAAQAMVWRDLVAKQMRERNRLLGLARERRKSKEAALQNKTAMEKGWQVDRQLLQDEIRSKDEIIRELTKQLKGSQKIDLEMEKKEQGLFH